MNNCSMAAIEAERLTEKANELIGEAYGDDRAGYGAIAQAQATVALAAEVQALRLQMAELLGDVVSVLEQTIGGVK
jgi:hypothetical protein